MFARVTRFFLKTMTTGDVFEIKNVLECFYTCMIGTVREDSLYARFNAR